MANFDYMVARDKELNVKTTNNFGSAKIRSQETFGLPQGAVFTIPKLEDMEVHWQVMPNAPIDPETGKPTETPYLIVKLKDSEESIRFYPSTLTKLAFECDNTGRLTGNIIRAKGKPAEDYCKYNLVKDGMAHLAGKTLKVVDIQQVKVRVFGAVNQTRTSNIPTFEYVEEG